MKRAVVYSEGVGLIAGLAHLPPAERPFAWLGAGPLRPSEAAGGLLARLPPGAGSRPAMQLQILKVNLRTAVGWTAATVHDCGCGSLPPEALYLAMTEIVQPVPVRQLSMP